MLHIRKDDVVMVITGKNKGKTGKVLFVYPKRDRAVVENVNIAKKAQRPTQQSPKGGIIEMENSLHLSNLMLIDRKSSKPTRVGMKILKDGTKTRISRRTQEVI